MKSKTLLFMVLCIAAVSRPLSGHCQSFLTGGLLAYYPLNGNALDMSGNGNDGTAFNGVSYVPGFSGFAAHFDATAQQYISLPTTISNYQDLTVTFWIKTGASNPNGMPSSISLVSRDIGGYDNDWNICLGEGRKIEFSATACCGWVATPNDLSSNTWVHVVCVADSTNQVQRIYINGQSTASIAWTPVVFANNYVHIFLGAATSSTDAHNYLTGEMADLRIYNRPLSDSEVQQLYQYESVCVPHPATATAELVNGFVVGANITDGGCGYTNTPAVFIQGGGGTGAAATAVVNNGVVVQIIMTDAGVGYTNAPSIYIYSPLGLQIGLVKALKPSFSNLLIGANYQLQVSGDLNNWTNVGTPFIATNPTSVYPQYWDVDNWGQLFFRLKIAP